MEKAIEKAKESLKKFLNAQIKEIEIKKFDEGVKIKKDPGSSFVLGWVKEHASTFRKDFVQKDFKEALADLEKIDIKDTELRKKLEAIKDKIQEGIDLYDIPCPSDEPIPLITDFLDTLKPLGFTPDRVRRACEVISSYISYILKNGFEIKKKK
ncbi:MAG: hypothetical protein WC976_07105 [Caldisericia bacterium]